MSPRIREVAVPPAIDVYAVTLVVEPITYTNAPAIGSEGSPSNRSRVAVDLRRVSKLYLWAIFSVGLPFDGELELQYSIDLGVSWSTTGATISGTTTNALMVGTIVSLPDAAKITQCWLRLIVSGDGVADPVLQKAGVSFTR